MRRPCRTVIGSGKARRVTLLTCFVLLALALPAAAAEFRAYGQVLEMYDGSPFTAQYDVSDDIQAGDGRSFSDSGVLRIEADSGASIGGLRAHGYALVREQEPNHVLGQDTVRTATAQALATYQITITGPPGSVMTSFNMDLEGTLAATSTMTLLGFNAASGGVGVIFRVNGAVLAGSSPHVSGDRQESTVAGASTQVTKLGVLVGWTPPAGVITSPPFTVQAGMPFTLQIELGIAAQANADGAESGFIAESNTDFGHTLSFVTNGPVFNLPAGYDVDAPDAGITDNRVPCTFDCTQPQSKCDAGKLGCVAKRQACLLKLHAKAEKKGEPLDTVALQKCADTFAGCVGKLESKQNQAKPKTLCSATGQTAALADAVDAFVTGVVTAIDPVFPTVGPPSICNGGKKTCVLQRTACLLKAHAAAVKKAGLSDPAPLQACADRFDGGAKGFAKGCLGKLEAKQNPEKLKTLCSVTGDVTPLEAAVDAFVADTFGAVLNLNLE